MKPSGYLVALLGITLLGTLGLGQTPSPTSPDTVVAIVNGRKMTAGEVERMVRAVPSQIQKAYANNPKQFMQEYAMYQQIMAAAEKAKLPEQSPYKEQLEFGRMLTLYQAQSTEVFSSIIPTPEQQKQHYEANKDKYNETKAKLIYIPFAVAPSPEVLSESDAKARAEAIAKEARGGADFIKLVKQHSKDPGSVGKDGDLGVAVRANTSQVPEPMRKTILSLKPNEISDPVRHENGFYIFRAESSGVLPYEQVKNEIYKELKDQGFLAWQKAAKEQSSVSFENEDFFKRPNPAQ